MNHINGHKNSPEYSVTPLNIRKNIETQLRHSLKSKTRFLTLLTEEIVRNFGKQTSNNKPQEIAYITNIQKTH